MYSRNRKNAIHEIRNVNKEETERARIVTTRRAGRYAAPELERAQVMSGWKRSIRLMIVGLYKIRRRGSKERKRMN